MRKKNIVYTLNILQRFYRDIRLFLPLSIQKDIDGRLHALVDDKEITLELLEYEMCEIGKIIYPYQKAAREFYTSYRYELGKKFFESRLSHRLRQRYHLFCAHGGTHENILTGHAVHFFTPEERTDFVEVAIDVDHALKEHTLQAIQSIYKKSFYDRVTVLQHDVECMQQEIEALYDLARISTDSYKAHIQATAKGIEHGFAFLGPQPNIAYVSQIVNAYTEHLDKNKKQY